MSTELAARARAAEPLAGSRTLVDRFLTAVPLLSVFLWLCVVYGWEAWSRGTPWLFGDELELTQLARSLAATGHAARRGEPHSFNSLYTLLIAPAWRLSTTQSAYSAVKYIGVLTMTLTVFPAYFLGRLVASRRAALFAAAASAAVPALVYSSFIVEETLAYPWATLCLFLCAKALLTRAPRWIVCAGAACVVAPLIKNALLPLPVIYVLAALLMLWTSERGRRWRHGWSAGDWIGFAFLLAGAIIVAGGVASDGSFEYLAMTRYYHGWVLGHALRGTGALTIGIGVLPLVAAFGAVWPAPGEKPSRALRAYRAVLVAAVLLFAFFTGIKGAYNQYSFGTRIWERNMLYVAPLLFTATALWLDRRRLNLWATAVGTGVAAFLLAWTPYLMQFRFSSDSPGLSILAQANRSLAFTPTDAKIALLAVLALSVALLVLPQVLSLPARAVVGLAAVIALFVVAWNLTGELSASASTNSISRTFESNIRGQPDWVDRITHGAPAIYLAQQAQVQGDQNSEWLLEFWNRSIQRVFVFDGCVCGPGPATTPDIVGESGVLKPQLNFRYVVVEPGIEVAGKVLALHSHKSGGGFASWRLIRVNQPLRLLGAVTGLYPDRWSQPGGSAYTRYSGEPGTMRIRVSRKEAIAPLKPALVTIRIGTLAIGPDRQPRIGRVTRVVRWTMPGRDVRTFRIPAPPRSFRVEVTVSPTFAPAVIAPAASSDERQLGAVLDYRFVRRKAAHT
ncbi:MAG: hypothetical protein ABR569_07660 [Gaiellaceae bacterium]